MGRILAIDYGQKNSGIAVTDNLKIIANSLTTVHTKDIFTFIEQYISKEDVEVILIGMPKNLKNQDSQSTYLVKGFVKNLSKKYTKISVVTYDERFTSKMAFQTMIDSGINRKKRTNKKMIDSISATIMLQDYLTSLTI